ncbi:hypothetical protein BURK1_01230 [Burkholderiales bacterium]|nr:hypothetical protein BURK1_01230 [Burkholderiales bacterium]
MSDDARAGPESGLAPSIRRLVAGALGLARTRFELAGVELALERERVQSLVILAVAGAVLATLAVAAISLCIVAYFWDTYRYAAIAGLAAVYGVLAAFAFARAASIVRSAPTPFSATIAEFEKDRALVAGERPPGP